jgi:hypothetical protein
MIIETNIKGFNQSIQNSSLNYPQCRCGNCPQMFFNLLLCAARQSGKTYSLVKLLRHYEENAMIDNNGAKHPIRTILISPTIEANPIFKSLKSLDFDEDVYDNYTEELLCDIMEDIKTKKQETEYFKDYIKSYNLLDKTNEKDLPKLYETNPEVFKILEQQNYAAPGEIQQPRYYETPITFILLDDLLGTGGFNNKRNSKLINNVIKNRHNQVCFIIAIQAMKGLPKNIRNNCSLFFLGKFASRKMILEDMYDEVSNVLTPESFEELYNKATEEQYGALVIDSTGKSKRFLKGWDIILEQKNNIS